MSILNQNLKRNRDLNFADFIAHPIWSWADQLEEDLVYFIDYPGSLPEEDHDALFVACQFILHDGTPIIGVVAVRVRDHAVYLLRFPKADGKFFNFSMQTRPKGLVTPEQLAAFLGKAIDDIFPIAYNTPYVWADSQPLAGEIELDEKQI